MPLTSTSLMTPFLTGAPSGTTPSVDEFELPNSSTYRYVDGSALEIPGLEAILEYGDASKIVDGRIPGALHINDRSMPDQVHVSEISGIHDDPDGRDTRSQLADVHGESAGLMLYSGRTIGLTGRVQSGSVSRMRDLWRKLRLQFGTIEEDLVIHPPYEVEIYRNEATNPFKFGTTGWYDLSGGAGGSSFQGAFSDGTPAVGVGRVISNTVSASILSMKPSSGPYTPIAWPGKDIFVSADMKVSATSGTVSSLKVQLHCVHVDGTETVIDTTQASPTTGTWYRISQRIAAASINPTVTGMYLSLRVVGSGSANYTTLVKSVQMVFLRFDQTAPQYFDGDTPGFEWSGSPYTSASFGPTSAVNLIPDPTFSYSGTSLLAWGTLNGSSVVVTVPPTRSLLYSNTVSGALYTKLTKDATATARDMTVIAINPTTTYAAVEQGRTYRWTLNANIVQRPAAGTLCAAITWLKSDGTIISTSQGVAVAGSGIVSATVQATAPAGAYWCIQRFGVFGSTTTSGVLEFFMTDPCMLDITDVDSVDFYGVGDSSLEVSSYVASGLSQVHLARRRIPRPFLLRGTRKTSDAKAPEQQNNLQYRRPFTMSLRASDPRIYCIDQHSAGLHLTGSPQLVVVQSEVFTLNVSPPPVPTGFIYEGHSLRPLSRWLKDAGLPDGSPNPGNGVGLGPISSADARPSSPDIARVYRSAEGYTFTSPRVVLGCAPIKNKEYFPPTGTYYSELPSGRLGYPKDDFIITDESGVGYRFTHQGWSFANPVLSGGQYSFSLYWNYVSILLKRVSSSAWIELRWHSVNHSFWNGGNFYTIMIGGSPTDIAAPLYPSAPYAFELVCSHNASGSASVTRLAGWDYPDLPPIGVGGMPTYPGVNFNPHTDLRWIDCQMVDNVITWSLWDQYPTSSIVGSPHNLQGGSYAIPSALQPIIGTGVAGQPGWSMYVSNSYDSISWLDTANNAPYIHYFEASKADDVQPELPIGVIGDIETPPTIVLKGDVVDPLLTMVSTDDKGQELSSYARFIGTFADANPVTIDVNSGRITDSTGANAYNRLQPGSDFLSLRPGVNRLALRAANWNTNSGNHAEVHWRDALT